MAFGGDERAQAVQIGAILLFAALIISLAGYQAFVVPDQTAGVEFGDFQAATGDMARLQGALLDAAGGTTRTVTVKTGSIYPSRTFSVNPPPASGTLQTTDARTVTLANAAAASGEANGTRNYFRRGHPGQNGNLTFDTKFVEFRPDYHEIDAPPVVASGAAGFRAFDSGSISPETSQVLMQGTRITLVTIAGDVSAQGLSSTVTVEPVSAATRTVTITGENGSAKPIGLRLPVSNRTSATAWANSAINDSLPDRYIDEVRAERTTNGEFVNITLLPAVNGKQVTYTLRMAKVEVREKSDSSVVDAPGKKYIIPAAGDNASVAKNQSVAIAAEVRDKFNNPVSGVNVSFRVEEADGTDRLIDSTFRPPGPGNNTTITDAEGRAGKTFLPNDAAGTAYINASFTDVGDSVLNHTNMTLSVLDPTGGGDAGTSNQPPNAIADIEPPGFVNEGNTSDTIQLDASKSSDPDGDSLRYQWRLQSSNGSFANGELSIEGQTVTYEPPEQVDSNLTVTAILNVSDGNPDTSNSTDRVTFTVRDSDNSGDTTTSSENAGRSLVVLTDVSTSGNNALEITLENVGTQDAVFSGYRLDYGYAQRNNGVIDDGPDFIDSVNFPGRSAINSDAVEYREPYFLTDSEQSSINTLPGGGSRYNIIVTFNEQITTGGGGPAATQLSFAFYIEGVGTIRFTITLPL